MPTAAMLLLGSLVAVPLGAQQPPAPQQVCDGHPIRAIRIQPSSLFAIEREPFSSFFQSIGNGLNWQTRPRTIRRELRFAPGELCDSRRLAESARVLRAQRYIRSAEIVTTPAPGDSVDVEVQTRDEWALSGSLRFDTDAPRAFKAARITEDNLFGRGMLGQVRYDYFGRRPGLVVDLMHRQDMGRSDAEVVAGRTSVGPVGELSVRRGFESEYDRIAFRTAVRWREEPFVFKSDSFGAVTQPLVSAGAEFALARRSGPVGRQTVVGVAWSLERLFPGGSALASLASDDSAATAQLAGRYAERRRAALSLFWGYRNVRFTARTGIDAVNAAEDVREGFELRLIAGRTFAGSGGLQQDWSGLLDLYGGAELGARTLAFARSRVEGRYRTDTERWDGIIGTADLFSYTAVSPRGVVALGVMGAGGWNTSTPFQLTVSSPATLRGFGLYSVPAGRRVVAQAEHRYFLGNIFGAMDVGSAAFVDVGRGWTGDAAFAVNSPTLVALGAGVRVGFPAGSKYVTRLDFAVPVHGGRGSELRLTVRQQFGVTSLEADDVTRSRLPVSTMELFNFTRY